MQSGKLRYRLIVRQKSVTRDGVGGEVITWVDLKTIWGEALPLRGNEYLDLKAAQSQLTTKFRVRYDPDIKSTMRVAWEGVDYEIIEQPIDVRGLHREMEILCSRGSDV